MMYSLVYLVACFSIVFCEPQCSPFHYHEQMLEKMVDVRYKVESFSNKLDRWEKIISEKLTTFDENLEKQKQLEIGTTAKLEEALAEKTESLDEIVTAKLSESDVKFGQLESQLSETVSALELELEAVESRLNKAIQESKTPAVLFKARSVRDQSPSIGSTIVFQQIVQTVGGGYNPDTGTFTAPVNGTYSFSAQFCLHHRRELGYKIVANHNTITAATNVDYDWDAVCSSTDGVAELAEGDEVKVMVAKTYPDPLEPGMVLIKKDSENRWWNYFSGVLLNN